MDGFHEKLWIRRDRTDGEQTLISEAQVVRRLFGFYENVGEVIKTACEAMPASTGWADYYPAPSN